ncbi:MAG TPA: DEAD/DEAH box helicase [Planctomycetota bacterium]
MDADPATFKGFTLAPFQRRAAAALDTGHNVLVAAPTGAGKTLVAEYAIHLAVQRGQRALYTAPIKALSNQKFRDFRRDPTIPSAGLMTGDVTVQPDARVLVMTTEILRNTLFEDPAKLSDVGAVVFDEVHFMDDPERGSVWEETLLFLPEEITIVALSATIANLGQLAAWLERARGRPIDVIEERKRPVPLKHLLYHPKTGIFPPSRLKQVRDRFEKNSKDRAWRVRDDAPLIKELVKNRQTPALVFCFSRRLCERKAQKAASRNFLNEAEEGEVAKVWNNARQEFGFEDKAMQPLKRFAHRGVGWHHAGMMPLHKEIVERLFTRGLLKFLYTTETFALGINAPARVVVFDSLTKFDGVDFDYLRTRDYMQMAGRAGRLGMDTEGVVYSVLDFEDVLNAPIHRIQSGKVEPIQSHFRLDYATLVHLHEAAGNEGAAAAWERSFAAWQAREHSKAREEKNRHRVRALLDKRFRFLDSMGYIAGERDVLARGRTCLSLYGYEIQLTEMVFEGVLENADPPALCGLVTAVIHESRRRDEFWRNALRPMRGLLRRAQACIDHAIVMERAAGLEASLKSLDEGMSPAMYAWASGKEFNEIGQYTSAAPGDFVRSTRMTVQYLRHLRKVVTSTDPDLGGRLTEAIGAIYRGPIDVRAELGLDEAEEPQ